MAYRPDRCEHPKDDGCMWCCQTCNYADHRCPGCGTSTDHKTSHCLECDHIHFPEKHEHHLNCKECKKELDAKLKELLRDYGYEVSNDTYVSYKSILAEDPPMIWEIHFMLD